jgi:hypothetical protein
VLRKIFGTKWDEVKRGWRKLHGDDLHDLHCWPNIIGVIKYRIMRWARHVARMTKRKGAYMVLVGRAERMRPPRRSRSKWKVT